MAPIQNGSLGDNFASKDLGKALVEAIALRLLWWWFCATTACSGALPFFLFLWQPVWFDNDLLVFLVCTLWATASSVLVFFSFMHQDTVKDSVDPTGGVPLLQPTLEELPQLLLVGLQSEDSRDVCHTLERLFTLFQNDGLTKEGFRLGAPAMLVLAMQKWQMESEVQSACIACIGTLTYIQDGDGHCAIAKSGCVEVILNSMRLFPSSDKLQVNGCCALTNILRSKVSEQTKIVIARRFVEEWDGLDVVAKVMVQFPKEVRLQAACCGILLYLSTKKEMRKPLVKAGAVPLVATAIENHMQADDGRVKKFGNGFMGMMFGQGKMVHFA